MPAPVRLPVVTAVGLGPAGAEFVTTGAVAALEAAPLVLCRTARHPAAVPLVAGGARALDPHYEAAATFAEAYAGIVEEVVAAAEAHGSVAYAVPGSPLVLESTVAALRDDPRVRLEVVPGLSFVELAFDRLGLDPFLAHVRLVEASAFSLDAAGDPGPLLVAQTFSKLVLSELKLCLEEPPAGPVVLLHHLGLADEAVLEVAWEEIDRALVADHLTSLYVPGLAAPVAGELVRAAEVVAVLRKRCPWDAAQTHRSLVRHLIEETYEAVEAIEGLGEVPGGDPTPEAVDHLEEELGDVLCQVLFHATLASEEGLFNLADVAGALADKLVRRHPHVFTEGAAAPDAASVLSSWEEQKRAEKGRTSLFEGIPRSLPALSYVANLERKAKGAGLGLTEAEAEALAGELTALVADADGDDATAGTVLLRLARLLAGRGVDPEGALRRAAASLAGELTAAEAAGRSPEA